MAILISSNWKSSNCCTKLNICWPKYKVVDVIPTNDHRVGHQIEVELPTNQRISATLH